MSYLYTAFGLVIQSDIPMQGMMGYTGSLPIDRVLICLDESGLELSLIQEKRGEAFDSEVNDRELLYKVEGVAHYYIRDGREILIRPFTQDIRLLGGYIYGRCMSAILFQRCLFPFHASGVLDRQGKLWMIVGRSHAGKSSTALKLSERGYTLFSDDLVLVNSQGGKLMAPPTYPIAGIRERTMQNQRTFSVTDGIPAITEAGRTNVFFHNRFVTEAKELGGVMFIRKFGEEISIEKLSSVQGMAVLKNNINLRVWLELMGKEKVLFQLLAQICREVPFWSVIRPATVPTYEELAVAIDERVLQ
ncbi:MAG: hypothetical protein JJU34_06930 [Lunatimonas sp.]|uniref:hypothetical protein n=1 Tax=Lunatimonas sp. TaxID=2060141 RepID=UPI00263A99C5|nr:hypothetical protein [Lunatimonas sp.]MCC5936997.1 hypothetical protein [Lunatimonas sp.]